MQQHTFKFNKRWSMNTRPPSVWPPPAVWGLGLLGYGYRSCKKIIRIIRMWESFSFSTPFNAATNFLLLDTEVMFDCDTTRTIPINFLFIVTTILCKQNEWYWAVAPISGKEKLFPAAYVGLLYYVHDFKIVHTLQIPLKQK